MKWWTGFASAHSDLSLVHYATFSLIIVYYWYIWWGGNCGPGENWDWQAREALSFIDGVVPNRHPSSLSAAADSRPFFAMIAPPACHAPFTPAPQFSRSFAGRRAPRWPSFNRHPGNDKHWLLRQAPQGALPKDIIDQVDHVFRQRWRTLLSVDQMVRYTIYTCIAYVIRVLFHLLLKNTCLDFAGFHWCIGPTIVLIGWSKKPLL